MDDDLSTVEEGVGNCRSLEFRVVDLPRPYQVESGATRF
jgi:hypothetical protein